MEYILCFQAGANITPSPSSHSGNAARSPASPPHSKDTQPSAPSCERVHWITNAFPLMDPQKTPFRNATDLHIQNPGNMCIWILRTHKASQDRPGISKQGLWYKAKHWRLSRVCLGRHQLITDDELFEDVYICVCVCVCACACVSLCVYVFMMLDQDVYVCTYVCMYVCTYVCT